MNGIFFLKLKCNDRHVTKEKQTVRAMWGGGGAWSLWPCQHAQVEEDGTEVDAEERV